jgi:hypothetical protein
MAASQPANGGTHMKGVHLDQGQPLLPLRGRETHWQRLPATVRETVTGLLSQLLAQQVRPGSATREERRDYER